MRDSACIRVVATRRRATQLCPCGYAGDSSGRCVCSTVEIMKYRARVSGPLADRIDLHVTVSAVPIRQFNNTGARETSAVVRARVEAARAVQRKRYVKMSGD